MLYVNDEYMLDNVKSTKRSKKQPRTLSLYEVQYVQDGFTNFYEVYAKNEGEANRKIKRMFGKVRVEATQKVN